MNTTSETIQDDYNSSLVDDWENYRAYTRFYHITDEIFLYANPILIFIGNYQENSNKYKLIDDIFQVYQLMHYQ